jgi:hypothetical protein
VRSPKITVTCDCGESRKVDYGESYTCTCGRTWSTASIPEDEYRRIRVLDQRYRLVGWAVAAVFGALVLSILLTRPLAVVFLAPLSMALWFGLLRPMVRRRHWRQVQQLTRSWKLKPEKTATQ